MLAPRPVRASKFGLLLGLAVLATLVGRGDALGQGLLGPLMGDGAGMLVQIPDALYRAEESAVVVEGMRFFLFF